MPIALPTRDLVERCYVFNRVLCIVTALLVSAGSASATSLTGGITEGKRDRVIGTTALGFDATPTPNGLALGGPLVAGDLFGIYGRIVSSQDLFELSFSSASSFEVLFDFDGYGTEDTRKDKVGAVTRDGTQSGLMSVYGGNNNRFSPPPGPTGKEVRFSLIDRATNTVVGSKSYFTNLNSASGSSPLIFAAAAGTYTLKIDGEIAPNKKASAFYDLNISVVPLPASVLLLLSGLAGLGLLGVRRRSRTA